LRCDNDGAFDLASNRSPRSFQENSMGALKELWNSTAGIMSVAGIAFMLGMGVFFIRYFLKHMREDGEAADRARP
jgi:Protein of unknown function (DUF3149)